MEAPTSAATLDQAQQEAWYTVARGTFRVQIADWGRPRSMTVSSSGIGLQVATCYPCLTCQQRDSEEFMDKHVATDKTFAKRIEGQDLYYDLQPDQLAVYPLDSVSDVEKALKGCFIGVEFLMIDPSSDLSAPAKPPSDLLAIEKASWDISQSSNLLTLIDEGKGVTWETSKELAWVPVPSKLSLHSGMFKLKLRFDAKKTQLGLGFMIKFNGGLD
uniref:Uncharacterized protein n=1 Tax=Chromera velia CCMP2878 TaxID=1169474 RepID=A0A0G4F5K9_9ALVE|eukprot:Cvel_15276.t1-p1 / transcript=Cvel_15276.t1 / gene=Cvel_15276 / organism=Chromera_velia_CCMP2878 / gene_product=hypothetical protein / transcript_product=hypothetical protein / location=Cvel_scaffold1121:4048-4692(+) / protein_length=215 / sequence_SO=supercontig / SO=protein_coding / is_pseudo=false